MRLGAASKEQIADAENELKLKFSEDYKEYLSTFRAATFCGKELTGICSSERLILFPDSPAPSACAFSLLASAHST